MSNTDTSLNVFIEALPSAHRDLLAAKTPAEFNAAFSEIMLGAVRRLEKDSKNLGGLNEDGLSSVLCGFINGTNALIVTREESSNGHVDFTFKAGLCKPSREVLGEAKIYDYYSWHESGLSQLVNRYSTGREDRGLLLEYVKLAGIKEHMEKLRSELDVKLPCNQVSKCSDHETVTQWSFCSSHKHSSGEQIEVWHFGCNLHHAEAKHKSKEENKAQQPTPKKAAGASN